ncbi:MAG: cytochrome c oxidase subunit 3 [Hyphomicrobiales bacterium]|uniref:cytochrome c oxidase subunit 3 n=1 Tax=Rhabdaerophilum calidifontis TaxID=2604328 RepID=UPI00123A8C7F|nr:cytochrome c oxidase subunit 3 [Rhabdaerophilum calidifontis]MCA1999381.1 cytochrome c oxidase subunit 3 [Hyphomicrobiales bacterium]
MADAHAKNHDYHILPLSPWPFVGSVSAFVMAVGAVMWMKKMTLGGLPMGSFLFFAGFLGVLYTMYGWWSDVVREANSGDHTRVVQMHHRYGMILFIASEVMFFVAWFWAYFDAALWPGEAIQFQRTELTGGHWPPKGIAVFSPWDLPLFNTLILLTSGTTVTWAHHALLHGDREGLKKGLWLTVALGVLFSFVQAYEYSHAGFKFSGHIYGATFFMATGFHGFHVLVGTIFLAICLIRAYRGDFTPKQHLGFEFAAWYWHFVDVVWLFLFAAIYFWGSNYGAAAGAAGAH